MLALIIGGAIVKDMDFTHAEKFFPAGLTIFAFLFVPLFLFYRFDKKQQEKERMEKEVSDSE